MTQWVPIQHSWKNGGDDSKVPTVAKGSNGRYLITADGDTDCDGSPRATQIDPSCGQGETSLRKSNGWKGEGQNVNSEKIPFFVLPLNWAKVTGDSSWHLGDMAKLTYKDKSIYAIFADEGPTTLIGEASLFAVEALGGNPWNKDKTRVVTGLPHGVIYEYIPGSANLARTIDFESIQAYGKELFESVIPNPKPTPQPAPSADFSVNFIHLKDVQADQLMSIDDSKKLWDAMQFQANDKVMFNTSVNAGVKSDYGNAQCAITTASVIEHAAMKAGLFLVSEIFNKAQREQDKFALTHQDEIQLKRLGFGMFDKKIYVAPKGAICMMAGRYNFAGCTQHSGHIFTMNTDKGAANKDIINDNGGFEHLYTEFTESFWLPNGIVPQKRGVDSSFVELKKGSLGDNVKELQTELNTHFQANLVVDGDFGINTENAVKTAQGKLGLAVNGIVSKEMWDKLKALQIPSPQPVPQPIPQPKKVVVKFVINSNDPSDVRGLDSAGTEIEWWNTNGSFDTLYKMLAANDCVNIPYTVQTLQSKKPDEPQKPSEPEKPKTISNAQKFISFWRANYLAVDKEVERWFAGVYSPDGTKNACVAHQWSALKLCGLPIPAEGSLESINVVAFFKWAFNNGWAKITDMSKLLAGDICVSGPSDSDFDHVYCFSEYIDANNAIVYHNQCTGPGNRALKGGTVGQWRFAMRMPEEIVPVPGSSKKKTIYVEPGHSKGKPGADSLDPKTNEYEMNELAYAIIAEEVTKAGHVVKTLNPDPDNLSVVGNGAKGCDAAISIHHNAYDNKEHYTRNYLAANPKQSSIALSNQISAAISKELGLKDAGYETSSLTVPTIFNNVCSGPSMLIELYFIDAYSNRTIIIDKTTRAAKAVAKILISWANS